jgi:hypothetical protein
MYRETRVTSEIRKRNLLWLGHVERRPEERSVKKVFKNIPEGKRFVGKPRKRQLYDVENYLKGTGVRGSTKIARDTHKRLGIDRAAGQSSIWTVQPMGKNNKKKKNKNEKETVNNSGIKETQ